MKKSDIMVDGEYAVQKHPHPVSRKRARNLGGVSRTRMKVKTIREDVRWVDGRKKTTKLYDCEPLPSDLPSVDESNSKSLQPPGLRTLVIANFVSTWEEYREERINYLKQIEEEEQREQAGPVAVVKIMQRVNELLAEHGVEIGGQVFKNVQFDPVNAADMDSAYRGKYDIYTSIKEEMVTPLAEAERKVTEVVTEEVS